MKARATDRAYVTAAGLLFALLQTGYFFELQFRLTAAYPSFLSVTLSWLAGSMAGLWAGRRGAGGRMAWLAASLCAYYVVVALLRRWPYAIGWLPVYGLLIGISGAQAGHFFASNRCRFPSVSRLFLWENNGFILGWIAGFAGYMRWGNGFLLAAPAVVACVTAALQCGGAAVEDRFRAWLAADGKEPWLLWLAGFNLILLNYTLIRQTMLAFRDLETAAVMMAMAYFAGISIGYLGSEWITAQWMRRLLPVFLVFQMALAILAQAIVVWLKVVSGETTAYVVVFILAAVGSTSLYAVFLPRFVQPDPARTGALYAVEIVGSLCGLASLAVLSTAGLIPVYGAYFLSFLGIAFVAGVRRWLIGAMACLMIAFLSCFDPIDRAVSAAFYKHFYAGRGIEKVVYTRYSPYHKIEVALANGNEHVLLLNNHWQFGPASHATYSYFVAEYPATLLRRPTVCLLGCGSMSTVGRMGDYASAITIVDMDRAVFETSREYFAEYNRLWELRNWAFVCDDAKHYLGTTDRKFDLIVDDIPPARTRQVALTYTREFFELVKSRLARKGIFSLPSLTPLHGEDPYGRRILATLQMVFDQVYVINDGDSSYYFATDQYNEFDEEWLRAAIDHPHKLSVAIVLPTEVDNIVKGVRPITINNMADLIRH